MAPSGERRPTRGGWRAITSVRGRLLLSTGLILGFGAVGTLALWSDTASISSGPITSGTLDLQIGGRHPQAGEIQWDRPGQDSTLRHAVVELDNVSPGESVAMELHVRNAGSTPLTFTGVGRSATDDMSPHLTASTILGGAATNSGTREAVNRSGTCSSGTTWWDRHVLSTSETPVTPGGAAVRLDPGERIQVCMLAAFSASAPGSFQGRTTTITVALRAKQVGAP